MDDAFQYIIKNGICTEDSYPYQGADGQCNSACSPVGKLNGFHDIPDENHIYTEIQSGPVSVAIEADQPAFQFYSGGVLDNIECGTNLDHGVLVVGYGSLNNQPYWIVKNSWGQTWGMDGYILIARGKNMCGIGESASRPYYLNENIQDHIQDENQNLLMDNWTKSQCETPNYKEICSDNITKSCFDCRIISLKVGPIINYYHQCFPLFYSENETSLITRLRNDKYECKKIVNKNFKPS
jgi:C1A family cysteine protease